MRILHSALMVSAPLGILNQMSWEQEAADKLGLPWKSILYCQYSHLESSIILSPASTSTFSKQGIRSWLNLRLNYYQWLAETQRHFDLILLRHSPADPLQLKFMRRYGKKTILVHHTKEIEEIRASKTLKSLIKSSAEKYFGSSCLKSAKGIIGVTPEIAQYETSRTNPSDQNKVTLIYPNGIFYDGNRLEPKDTRTDTPELLFIASHFSPWHGLDLLLHQTTQSSDKFILHVVGELEEKERALAEKEPRVRLHGSLGHDEIRLLISRCWLGLSSFALHRKSMRQACTLKVREYLANGLPVYAGHDDVFSSNFPYYRQGPPEINSILAYAHEMRSVERLTIRNSSGPLISKESLLNNLYLELHSTQ